MSNLSIKEMIIFLGKPCESQGRKAAGLRTIVYDCQAAVKEIVELFSSCMISAVPGNIQEVSVNEGATDDE